MISWLLVQKYTHYKRFVSAFLMQKPAAPPPSRQDDEPLAEVAPSSPQARERSVEAHAKFLIELAPRCPLIRPTTSALLPTLLLEDYLTR